MFENVGKRLKVITKVFFYVAEVSFLIGSFFTLLGLAVNEKIDLFLALVLLLVGVPLSMFFIWVSYLFVYGFCELVDKSTQAEENTDAIEEKIHQVKGELHDIKFLLAQQMQNKEQ